MYEQIEKPKENKSRAVANSVGRKKSNVTQGFGFVDNRHEAIMQKKAQSLADSSNQVNRQLKFSQQNGSIYRAPVQFGKGDPDDPHLVHEGNYTRLDDTQVGEAIVVPDISGCAAVRLNVFSGRGTSQTLVHSTVLHSDCLEASIESASQMAKIALGIDVPDKSVSLVVVTNLKWNSMGDHLKKVLPNISGPIEESGLPFKWHHIPLSYVESDTVDVDMTGTVEEIQARYTKLIADPAEADERIQVFEQYKNLLIRRDKAGRNKRHKRSGRRNVDDPRYIPVMPLEEFGLLGLEDRKTTAAKLNRQLANDPGSGWCFLTTACVEHQGKADDCYELTMLRDFRDCHMLATKEGRYLVKLYYDIAPKIVEAIEIDSNKKQIYEQISSVIDQCVSLINKGENQQTMEVYCEMVARLAKTHLPQIELNDWGNRRGKP